MPSCVLEKYSYPTLIQLLEQGTFVDDGNVFELQVILEYFRKTALMVAARSKFNKTSRVYQCFKCKALGRWKYVKGTKEPKQYTLKQVPDHHEKCTPVDTPFKQKKSSIFFRNMFAMNAIFHTIPDCPMKQQLKAASVTLKFDPATGKEDVLSSKAAAARIYVPPDKQT